MAERARRLDVELDGDVVAHLEPQRRASRILLRHTEFALDRFEAGRPVISCSVPVMPHAQDATAYLEGLLPEGQARTTLAALRDVRAADTWGLLVAYGRDVAGALVIRDPDDTRVRTPRAVDLRSPDELTEAVAALVEQPLGVRDDSELSLAGVQDKLLLVASDGPVGWARPTAGHPSTHILKPDPLAHPGVVLREAEALAIARRVGLTTIDPMIIDVGGRPALIVERYDRRVGGAVGIVRLHQEDLLQATGTDPRAVGGRVKYQEHGGPGWRDAAIILTERADDADAELRMLVGALVFTVLIGNSDAHARNLSLLLDPPGNVRLAPLYDTVPTMLFTRLRVRCAMWVGGVHRSLGDVTTDDLLREITGRDGWKVTGPVAARLVDEWIDRLADAADDTLTGAAVRRRVAQLRR